MSQPFQRQRVKIPVDPNYLFQVRPNLLGCPRQRKWLRNGLPPIPPIIAKYGRNYWAVNPCLDTLPEKRSIIENEVPRLGIVEDLLQLQIGYLLMPPLEGRNHPTRNILC